MKTSTVERFLIWLILLVGCGGATTIEPTKEVAPPKMEAVQVQCVAAGDSCVSGNHVLTCCEGQCAAYPGQTHFTCMVECGGAGDACCPVREFGIECYDGTCQNGKCVN